VTPSFRPKRRAERSPSERGTKNRFQPRIIGGSVPLENKGGQISFGHRSITHHSASTEENEGDFPLLEKEGSIPAGCFSRTESGEVE
jgi:hypothetical protein